MSQARYQFTPGADPQARAVVEEGLRAYARRPQPALGR